MIVSYYALCIYVLRFFFITIQPIFFNSIAFISIKLYRFNPHKIQSEARHNDLIRYHIVKCLTVNCFLIAAVAACC